MPQSFNFVDPARTRVLVVPLLDLDPHFDLYFNTIRRADDIRLLDVAPLPECRNFNPQTFPQGRILYDFSTGSPDEDVLFLHDFEPFRKTFVVLGLGSYKDYDEKAAEKLAANHPTAIVHNCIYFDAPPEKLENHTSNQKTFFVPAIENQNVTTLETTMCAVTENYITALASYVASYEKITLRSPVSLRDGTALHKTITYAQKKVNSGSSFKVSFSKNQTLPSTPDLKVKASQRQTGRQAKLTGNFLLLAGQANEALQYLTDAAINLKKADDNLWLGSALEGLAVASLMLSYLGISHQAQNPMLASVLHVPKSKIHSVGISPKRNSTDSIASKQSNGVQTPRNSTSSSRSAATATNTTTTELAGLSITDFLRLLCNKTAVFYHLSDADFENCVPDLVYIEFLLRSIRLFLTIYLAGEASEFNFLQSVVKGTPLDSDGSKDPAIRLEIISFIDQIFNMQLIDLDFFKQCRIYHTLALIYSDLGLRRKRAFILRILLVALLPKLNYKTLQTEFASPKSLSEIFEYLFNIYQIGKETEASEIAAYGHHSDWISLQLLVLKICLKISEAQKDYETLAKICVLILARYTHCLPNDDQIKLKRKLDWLNLLSKEDHNDFLIPHPDPFLIRNAKFVLQLLNEDLIPFQSPTSVASNANDSLIFNPFNKLPKDLPSKEKLICINELHHIIILLQNPFAFDLNISDITIVGDDEYAFETVKSLMRIVGVSGFNKQDLNKLNGGLVFQPNRLYEPEQTISEASNNISVPQFSLCHVIVGFKVRKAGTFNVSEVDITFGGFKPQRFNIIDQEKWRTCESWRQHSPIMKTGESGDSILNRCITNLSEKQVEDRASKKKLTITAIPSQASLSLVANLVANGWVMLLEGENKDFSIRLKNTSDLPINYLSFSFWDSTNDSINQRLNHAGSTSQMLAEDIHELEWQLLESKPFTVVNKSEIASKYKIIQPQAIVEFKFQMHGKRGMAELKLILEYCNKTSDENSKNYIKSISVPFNVTVQPSLEIIGCDVIPFFSTSLQGFKLGNSSGSSLIEKNISELLNFISNTKEAKDDEISQYCLLILDVKNLWKEKLALQLSNEVQPGNIFEVSEKVEPSKTSRLLIPVRRLCVEEIDISRPIPSLRRKQFVKNYAITAEEEEQNRKNFWIKSSLQKGLKGLWRSFSGRNPRQGIIDLRSIRLDNRMANALVYDKILIQHSIWAAGNKTRLIEKEENEYVLEKEKFYTLKTKIVNHTKTKISGVLRHVPFPTSDSKLDMSIDQRIFFNGVLQRFIGPNQIVPGGSFESDLGFMILEKGRYEWGSIFDDFSNPGRKTVGREPVYITVI